MLKVNRKIGSRKPYDYVSKNHLVVYYKFGGLFISYEIDQQGIKIEEYLDGHNL
jgi:hypothetical protein